MRIVILLLVLILRQAHAENANSPIHYILQAGQTFLDPALEKNANEYNSNPDGTRKLAMKTVTIQQGESIVFRNRDVVAHNIASQDFDLKVQEKGTDTQPLRFDTPGEFDVRCMIHPKMKLKVVVRPKN